MIRTLRHLEGEISAAISRTFPQLPVNDEGGGGKLGEIAEFNEPLPSEGY